MEATIGICPECGSPLAPDAAPGLCPVCLGQRGPFTPVVSTLAPVKARLTAGQVYGGYHIERLLGHGGMGEVYQAEQLATSRKVALKVMSHALDSETDRRRFLREGRLAAMVNHPNVVYVHGSEEIEGMPAIAMELALGGTLNDRLAQNGPLPVAEAVEAVLQIISGLEAALAVNVLHRDIKPSNCFIARDGTVKVGDFGLSITTGARADSLVTSAGAVMGTPAYASPEQLRGEEPGLASDLYSVGATLYHLLTGRLPFQGSDFVKLITEVIEKPPEAPQAIRPEIPEQLSRIILRCLAKEPKVRYASYAELRDALLPFSRAAAEPARLGPRFAAGLVDALIASFPIHLYELYWSYSPMDLALRERSLLAVWLWLPFFAWYFGYFALCEGRWGAGLGKSLLGLRVVGLNRDVPGFSRAAWRTMIYMLPDLVPAILVLLLMSAEEFRLARAQGNQGWFDWLGLTLFLTLYATMWRRFGYVALLDRVSRTRVIVTPRAQPRPALATAKVPGGLSGMIAGAGIPKAVDFSKQKFGPYETIFCLWQHERETLLLGVDNALRRQVWICLQPEDSAPVSPARRELSRPGRLRWLNGGVHAAGRWDAYDALDGEALMDVATAGPQPWNAVRFWLLDLAREWDVVRGAPEIAVVPALDRIWITPSGQAVWLDFPAPHRHALPGDERVHAVDSPSQGQRFLAQVARRALELPQIHDEPSAEGVRAPVPLHARDFLARLTQGGFDSPASVTGNLESLAGQPATIRRMQRFWSMAMAPAIVCIIGIIIALAMGFDEMRWSRSWANAFPDKPSLRGALAVYQQALAANEQGLKAREAEMARAFLVQHFGILLTNDAFWARPDMSRAFDPHQQALLRQTVISHLPPAPEVVNEAERVLPPLVREQELAARVTPFLVLFVLLLFSPWIWALVELASAVFGGKARMLDLLGMAVVDGDGRPASRLRLGLRWLIVWLPLVCLTLLTAVHGPLAKAMQSMFPFIGQPVASLAASILFSVLIFALLAVLLAAVVYGVLRPERSLQDRLANTWLVLK